LDVTYRVCFSPPKLGDVEEGAGTKQIKEGTNRWEKVSMWRVGRGKKKRREFTVGGICWQVKRKIMVNKEASSQKPVTESPVGARPKK